MKTKILFALLVSSFIIQHSSFGQGVLTPPGAPAPTMKSLDQIEARTPISSAPFAITQPGSYYLTTNLTVSSGDAIEIYTNGVTLDLNGFTISSTAASATGTAILLAGGLQNITIVNGHIQGGVTNNGSGVYSGSGFAYGIESPGNAPVNVLVSRVSVSGCLIFGIYLNTGGSTMVESCTVRTVGRYGIVASTVKSCSAMDCGDNAITGDEVSDCRGQSSGSGNGLYATAAAQNCYGESDGSDSYGLYANTALNCYGTGTGTGLNANTAQNCYGYSDGGTGLSANNVQNCSGESDGSGSGIYAAHTATGCYGYSDSGYGIIANIAIDSLGDTSTGTGLNAIIANSCYSTTGDSRITYKYNMP